MKVVVMFETDSAAFEELFPEIGQLFAQAQRKLARQLMRIPSLCDAPEADDVLLDLNGNTVGSVKITHVTSNELGKT